VVGGTNLLLSPLRKQQLEPLMEKGQKSVNSAKENGVETTQKISGGYCLAGCDAVWFGRYQHLEKPTASFFRVESMIYRAGCCSALGTRLSKF